MEDQAEYKAQAAAQQKLAAMFAANKDEVSVPKIYIDMTNDIGAAAVLDELMFWTLPKKGTGKTSLRVFKRGALWLAVRRKDWWDRKRLTERQADGAIAKLVSANLIEKDIFLFDGKPTVHIRMNMTTFVKMYGDKMQEIAGQEEDENLIRDISDLYSMMGFHNETVNSNLPNGEMLNLPNGEIINSLQQPEDNNKYISKQKIKGIEAAIFSDRPVTSDDLPIMEVALKEFEAALSLPANWNWYPAKSGDEKAWRELRDFVLEKWQADNQAFRKYATWRATPYVKGALSNLAIQRRPTEFITSWSDYLASSSMSPTDRSKGFAL